MKYELRLLYVGFPDYFQGYSGKYQTVMAFVDGNTTYYEMIESIENTTNNEERDEPGFWEALEQAIEAFPKQLGPSDSMDNRAFPNLETPKDDDEDFESSIAYFAVEDLAS